MALAHPEAKQPGYNERLFSGGLRAGLHLARFRWAQKVASTLPHQRILEIGCFDGRLLNYVDPDRYVGIDAGVEGGIDEAIVRCASDQTKRFIKAGDPSPLTAFPARSFDLGVALETLEHISPETLDAYLAEVARLCDYFLVTVPNEKGPVFLAKWLVKRGLYRDSRAKSYGLREVLNATLCRLHLVRRDEHKGFDYADLIHKLSKKFQICSVTGLPFGPPLFGFTVAIVARAR